MTMVPDTRRTIRTIVHTVGAIVMIGFLGWIIDKSEGEQLTLIGLGLVSILMLRELFHGVENVAARVKFGAGKNGVNAEIER